MKKIFTWVFLVVSLLFVVGLFVFKDQLNNAASSMMYAQLSEPEKNQLAARIDSLYNYKANGQMYKITFLEFGSTGCSACKRMESVMQTIEQRYAGKVQVVMYHISRAESRQLMKYYGVSVIPTQILLDDTGNPFLRHAGFCPEENLEEVIQKKLEK